MDISNEKRVLQEVINIAPYIPLFIDEPVSVAVTNKEAFIFNQPCEEIPVQSTLGEPFPAGSTPGMVISSGERIRREVPPHVYGVPFMSYAIPLWEDGEVVGCLMIAKSIEKIKGVKDAISTLSVSGSLLVIPHTISKSTFLIFILLFLFYKCDF